MVYFWSTFFINDFLITIDDCLLNVIQNQNLDNIYQNQGHWK